MRSDVNGKDWVGLLLFENPNRSTPRRIEQRSRENLPTSGPDSWIHLILKYNWNEGLVENDSNYVTSACRT